MFRIVINLRKPINNLVSVRRYATPDPPCKNDPQTIPLRPIECFDFSINDMPVPKGSWHEKHKQTQSYYNKVLIGGVLMLLSSIIAIYANVDFYTGVAEKPAPRP